MYFHKFFCKPPACLQLQLLCAQVKHFVPFSAEHGRLRMYSVQVCEILADVPWLILDSVSSRYELKIVDLPKLFITMAGGFLLLSG